MNHSIRFVLGLGFAALALTTSGARAATLLGSSYAPTLYDVSTTTGAATNPRTLSPPVTALNGLALNSSGQVYGLVYTGFDQTSSALSLIDPTTGAQTIIGQTGVPNAYEGDLDFNPLNGKLYGIYDALNTASPYRMFEISTATGAASNFVTLTGADFDDPSAMSFSASGILYVLETAGLQSILYTVNPVSGAVTSTLSLSVNLGIVAGMDFNPDNGLLYIADGEIEGTNQLYTADLTTGVLTPLGTTAATGLTSLTFVPEPGSAIAVAGAGLLPAVRRDRPGRARRGATRVKL